jgi:hypothetical protein
LNIGRLAQALFAQALFAQALFAQALFAQALFAQALRRGCKAVRFSESPSHRQVSRGRTIGSK